MRRVRFLALSFCLTLPTAAQRTEVTELKIRTVPASTPIRPFETAVVQVQVYGKLTAKDGKEFTGRLQQAARARVADKDGGWLSKPFRFQGEDTGSFVNSGSSTFASIFGAITSQYVLQDSYLYTAPEKPGEYKIEAALEGKTATTTIRVETEAPSVRVPEKVSFQDERISLDPYRALAEHYAPMLAQETWFQPKSDYIARFDFDGDWNGDNNWESLEQGSSQAYVYYATMETRSHWFVIYNVFHPRDYSDKCVVGTCHENDNEGLIVGIAKDGTEFGRLQTVETLAHNNVYSFCNDDRVRPGAHNIDGRIEFYRDSHPVVFIESGGHGIYGSKSSHARYLIEKDEFGGGTGVTYIYKGVAERPRHANDRLVGYQLLPIYEHWWQRANSRDPENLRMFDDYYAYQPVGGRPGVPHPQIAGAFLGRKEAANKAKPFWGWHDSRTSKKGILSVGQWGLDPAYAVSVNLRFPPDQPVSLAYLFNPYLGIGPVEASAPTAAPGEPAVSAPVPSGPNGYFEFRAHIDGSVDALIQGASVNYEVLSGGPVRNPESGYSEPFPAAVLGSVQVEKKEGRGSVRLVESPSAANGFTTRVRIEDPKGGAARYHVVVKWTR